MYCIAGADGFFGAYIQRELLGSGENVIALNHRAPVFPDGEKLINLNFDVSDGNSLCMAERLLRRFENINMIYLVAAHAPDAVRADPERAMKINREFYCEFLKKLSFCDIKALYYSSSDTVYGESTNGEVFTEASPLSPINVYGEQKAEAERVTLENGFSVARFPYMFAPSICTKKHFFDDVIRQLSAGKPVYMFTDYVRSSLTYGDAAYCLYRFIKTSGNKRVINICADKPSSKYDIGLLAAKYCGADSSLVVPTLTANGGVFTERRAKAIIMSNELMKKELKADRQSFFPTDRF